MAGPQFTSLPRISSPLKAPAQQHDGPVALAGDEYPPCALCEGTETVPLVRRKGYQVVRCATCCLVYVSPRPRSQEQIDALYTKEDYSGPQITHALHAQRMQEARWRLDQVEKHAPNRGRLLDVGCSAGSFLLVARERGWDVHGMDVSPAVVEYNASAHGLDTRVGTVERSPFEAGTFDVVTLFECIEHMLHPGAALVAVRQLLREGGLLVMTTPNIDGLVPRTTYQLLGRTIGAWEHPTPPHHLYQFSRRTLGALLKKSGFEVMSSATRPMGLSFTVKQLQSAVLESMKRVGGSTAAVETAPAAPRNHATDRSKPSLSKWVNKAARRTVRAVVGGFCWALTLPLYAVPVRSLGAGDSMIIVARK